MPFLSQNPFTGETYFSREELSSEQINVHLNGAEQLFNKWRKLSVQERCNRLKPIADHLRSNTKEFAEIMTREMGKPITESIAEIEKCALLIDYYTREAPNILAPEVKVLDGEKQGVRRDPIGAVLGVMPWNFPFWQVFRFAVPSILAGNIALLKHAPNMPAVAEKIEELFLSVTGERVLTQLMVKVEDIPQILDHPIVRGACLTGSVDAGKSYAREAAERLIPTVLELGSSDPFIILEDADVTVACEAFMDSRFGNTGQTCIASKRLIVHASVAEEVQKFIQSRIEGLSIGNPMDENTDISCMAREDLAQKLEEQWEKSVRAGAEVLISPSREGAKFSPAFLKNPAKDSPAWREELFGPVAVMVEASDQQDAISLANDTIFGLGASVWTQSRESAEECIRQLDFGTVVINQKTSSDPRWPFGGFKESGYGRELGREGMLEFVNLKTFKINL